MERSKKSALLSALQLALLVFPVAVYGQTFRFGVIGLYQVNDKFHNENSHSDAALLGPSVEVRLPLHLSVETDALYQNKFSEQHEAGSYSGTSGKTTYTADLNSHAWEVPVLVHWQGLKPVKGLFVGGGVSFRNVSGTSEDTMSFTPYCFDQPFRCPPPTTSVSHIKTPISDLPNHFTYGGVVSSGMDIRVSSFRIRPQFRYIRWNTPMKYFDTGPNTFQVLVGFAYEKRFQH